MFRKMRRIGQLLDEEKAIGILEKGSFGTLALSGDDGYPYALPISYVLSGRSIFFHSALSGHKIDSIKRNPKCSFSVVGKDDVFPEAFTTRYESVIAFGRISIVEDDEEKMRAIRLIGEKYCSSVPFPIREDEIEKSWNALLILKMKIEHLTGKKALEVTLASGKDSQVLQ